MNRVERTPEEIERILQQLGDLQDVDRELLQTTDQLAVFPGKLQKLQTKLDAERRAHEEARGGKSDQHAARRALESEDKNLEEEIQKHLKRQMEVKTNKEYAAVGQEIETLRRRQDEIETEILELIEQEEEQAEHLVEADKHFQEFMAEAEEERERIRQQVQTKKEKIDRLTVEQQRMREKIPEDVLRLYDRLSQRHPGNVVVPAVDSHCGGCHMSLVSQKMVEIRQMKKFVQCEGCLRVFTREQKSQ